jgi:hypothetical protein
MLGNVWEWCEDGDDATRAVRGGSCYDEPEHVRASSRDRSEPAVWDGNIGFRCVRDGRRRLRFPGERRVGYGRRARANLRSGPRS